MARKRIRIAGFPERLKSLINATGMTQRAFAKRVGIDESVVSYYISGKRFPNRMALFCMASVLYVSVDELLGKKGRIRTPSSVSFEDAINSINSLCDVVSETDCPVAIKMCETVKDLLNETKETLFWEYRQRFPVNDRNDKQ